MKKLEGLVDPVDPAALCSGKVAFDTFTLAKQINQARSGRRHLARVPYRCTACHKWHLGTQKHKRHGR
jgi:hypothetical protein